LEKKYVRINNKKKNYYELTGINSIFLKLDNLLAKVNSIEKSIQFCSDKINDYRIEIQFIANQVQNFDIKTNLLESKYTISLNINEVLESKLNEQTIGTVK